MPFYNIRPRAGTASQWSTANTILREREIGFEYPDEGPGSGPVKMKQGDGTTPWNDLPYATEPVFIRDGQGNAVYDLPITPQPNLLMNADFKSGIINQRGQTTYAGKTGTNTYTIDRWWISKSTTATLSVNSGYISVSLPTLQSVGQFIEFEPDGEMTVAIKLKDEDLKVITVDNWTDYGTHKAYRFEIETNVSVTLAKYEGEDNWQLFIYNTSESTKTFNIEYMKLEKGSIYTGMPQWDETTELLKCMRYFQYLDINETIWSTQYNNQFEQNIMFMLPMVKTPSITTDITDNYNVTSVSAIAKDKNRCSLRYTLDNSIGNGHRIGLRINADAETY